MVCCTLHKLRFVAVEGFEEDTPDFSSVLGAFAARRCKAAVSGDVRHRVPLCADVEATDDSPFFLMRTNILSVFAESMPFLWSPRLWKDARAPGRYVLPFIRPLA